MKTLSVLAGTAIMAAVLAATGASAQGTSQDEGARSRDSAAAAQSQIKHQTEARKRSEGVHGRRSYASAERSRSVRGRAAANAFDGEWSVLIETRVGGCAPSFRYGVAIQNGEVLNAGGAQVSLAGHVAPNGVVRVSVAAGNQEAHGAGRLSRTAGGGTWRGEGSAGTCAGVWQAERRG